jgi:F-box/WD-40 domain protein MET30
MFNPHQPVAGPSARPIRPLPLNNLYDASPEKTVNPGSISAPPAIPTFTASDDNDDELDVVPSRGGRKLCVRHKQMANQNVNAKLQKVRRRRRSNLDHTCLVAC